MDTNVVYNSKDKTAEMTCNFCSSTFPSKILLEAHRCREAVYFCKICSLESSRPRPHMLMPRSEAERHFCLHFHPSYFGTKDPAMPDCQMRFKYKLPEELQGKTSLLKYDEVHLLKDLYIGVFHDQSGEDGPYHCGLCGATFGEVGSRKWHVRGTHLDFKNRKCAGKGCENLPDSTNCHQDKLLRHMFRAHCELVTEPAVYLKCKFCTMQFRDRTDLEWHLYYHMEPAVNIGTPVEKQPEELTSKDGSMAKFRCTICSFESIDSIKLQLYTAAEAHEHLAWHWVHQLPPEIRKTPNLLNFETDSDTIHRLYITPHASKAIVRCKFCDKEFPVEVICKHLQSQHRDYVMKPYICMYPKCKHLQFIQKKDFFGHMFLQHVSVIKRKTFMFSCQICSETFRNRSQVEWHCYDHRARLTVSATRRGKKLS
ncbi:zinc finger protein 808-like [Branchiostoma lanceolatum]|uniref:zinc finger protein 808-like n=1 Tax=Branchiostoma lanceolatum TaxID=7740 RepID=UPI0034567380